jgi:rhamnopyranosyl-N-acetylglucosaminyl-diphospho-decaprenol beta-1,3/1,4-galactofuranosyltransferase
MAMQDRGSVAALVVTHNRRSGLEKCIAAIREQTIPVGNTVVVDNASTDGTREWLEQQHDVISIAQPNLGPAGGYARALREGLQLPADYLWTMDDDCLPKADALERLLDSPALADPRTIVASMVLSASNPRELAWPIPLPSSYVRWVDWHRRRARNPAMLAADADESGFPYASFFNSVLFPREAPAELGLPRREFFVGDEEVEYLYRARAAGYRTYTVIESVATHPSYRIARPRWQEAYRTRNRVSVHRAYRRWPRLRVVKKAAELTLRRRFDLFPPLLDGVREDFSRSYRSLANE